jgi:hypothetical protein
MATPTYTTVLRGRRWEHHTGKLPGAGGSNRWFGGRTPEYTGSGQPELERGGSFFSSGTPAFMSAPNPGTATHNATATAPQADALAIVVPCS